MSIQHHTRTDDEILLRWLRLRCNGVSSAIIGAAHGTTSAAVRVATNRVADADVEGRDAYGWAAQ